MSIVARSRLREPETDTATTVEAQSGRGNASKSPRRRQSPRGRLPRSPFGVAQSRHSPFGVPIQVAAREVDALTTPQVQDSARGGSSGLPSARGSNKIPNSAREVTPLVSPQPLLREQSLTSHGTNKIPPRENTELENSFHRILQVVLQDQPFRETLRNELRLTLSQLFDYAPPSSRGGPSPRPRRSLSRQRGAYAERDESRRQSPGRQFPAQEGKATDAMAVRDSSLRPRGPEAARLPVVERQESDSPEGSCPPAGPRVRAQAAPGDSAASETKAPGAASQGPMARITFQPGRLGISWCRSTGEVVEVDAGGQAWTMGVEPGWTIVQVSGQPYSKEALDARIEGRVHYSVTFRKGHSELSKPVLAVASPGTQWGARSSPQQQGPPAAFSDEAYRAQAPEDPDWMVNDDIATRYEHQFIEELGPKCRTAEFVGAHSTEGGIYGRIVHNILRCADWFSKIEEPPRKSRLAKIVLSTSFQSACGLAILLNSFFTFMATNYEIDHEGDKLPAMEGIEGIFLMIYTTELILKLVVHQWYFFVNEEMHWNIFDLVLICLGINDQIWNMAGGGQSTNATFMRTLRLLKLGKALRVFRLMRFFSELRLILDSLMGSVTSLFWTVVMMLIMFYIFGLVFVQGVSALIWGEDANNLDPSIRDRLLDQFGSVEKAMFTLFKAATGGDDWSVYYNALRYTGLLYSCVYVFFIVFNNIAFMNILTALFVENASRLAQPDRDAIVLAHRENLKKEYSELKRIISQVDKDGSGTITEDEFDAQMVSRLSSLRSYLEFKGVDRRDAKIFFQMLSLQSPDHRVHIESFMLGAIKIKGTASSLDIQTLACHEKVAHRRSERLTSDIQAQLQLIRQDQEKIMADMDLITPRAPSGQSSDRRHYRGAGISGVTLDPWSGYRFDDEVDTICHTHRDESGETQI